MGQANYSTIEVPSLGTYAEQRLELLLEMEENTLISLFPQTTQILHGRTAGFSEKENEERKKNLD